MATKQVWVVDYGMGNLGSVRRAFEECGASVSICDDPKEMESAERIVIPGVGAFCKGSENLRNRGWMPVLKAAALERKIPMLGICLGMQLLADRGHEFGDSEGLGLIPGEVVKLQPTPQENRIPHMGWNEVEYPRSSKLFENIPAKTDFYFVHSFHFAIDSTSSDSAIGITPYCGRFVSAVQKENIFGVQFHPEKSQKPGFALIRNFLEV